MGTTLASRYDASGVESKWYAAWEQAGLFQPDPDPSRPRYTITIPPPNITGSLHMGHALCYPIQDLLGRYWRLRGKSVLIQPGTDHAGIATQSVVIKNLKKQGISPATLTREQFLEHVWAWRTESGDAILKQFRALGCAFDWSRQRFTLDDDYVVAVLRVFVDWFERGLIFRGKRVVNWDPVLRTSVSDIEVERRTVRGKLYYIRYPFSDGSGFITIATTRPETMLADVAVAVHPRDARYKASVGKTLVLPLLNREIPLIADIYPDPEFGSGAVKITPAHDANDYEVGIRHGLAMPVVIGPDGKMTEEAGPYAGIDRLEARKRIAADLQTQGYLDRVEDYDIPLLVSERSGEPIEPLLSEEWFASQKELAKLAADAVRSGQIKFVPERYEKIFLEWLENIRDWNISRKLWWGHRIPVYYTASGKSIAALSWNEAQAKAGDDPVIQQDESVLDTWFSSGLWPFTTLGWPGSGDLLEERYPTSVLVTSREILYLWVARMVMMGLDQVGKKPFDDVYIYATVLTEDGRRMSKSLGTGVDPMGVIESIGADALRFTLMSQAGYNQDIRYSERKTEESRNFCNKIWNATRFVLMNLDENAPAEPAELDIADRWILSRLAATEQVVSSAYESYNPMEAADALYRFFWSELCDWYIEISKSRLNDPATRSTPQWVLLRCLEAFLPMLHPLMPFITEELYAHLPNGNKHPFLMSSNWPMLPESWRDPVAESDLGRTIEITRSLRALRAELGLAPMRQIERAYAHGDLSPAAQRVLADQAWILHLETSTPPEEEPHVGSVAMGVELGIPIGGLIDPKQELERIHKEREKLAIDLKRFEVKLQNPQFVERAKPEVVERERAAADEAREKLAKLEERAALFAKLG